MPKPTNIDWKGIAESLEDGQWHTILYEVPHSTYGAILRGKMKHLRGDCYEFTSTNTVRRPGVVNGRTCDVLARKVK